MIHGHDSVIKIVDADKDFEGVASLEHEANMYNQLVDMWGRYIPSKVFSGPMAIGRSGLATTYEGQSLDSNALDFDLSKTELKNKATIVALQALHNHGVLHGDIALRNIVVNPDTRSVKLIDIGSAKKVGSDKEKMQSEMNLLSTLMDNRLSGSSMAIDAG